MSRLFISLYISLTIGIGIYLVGVIYLPEKVLSNAILNYERELYKGTFYMLDSRMQTAENQTKELTQIQGFFGRDIQLLPLDKLSLNQQQKELLVAGNIQKNTLDGANHVYIQSFDKDRFWMLQTEESYQDDAVLAGTGTGTIIKEYLQRYPEQQWQERIKTLAPHFGIPLSIIAFDELDKTALSAEDKQRLIDHQIAKSQYGTPDQTFYFKIQNSDAVIVAGPLGLPLILRHITLIVILILGLIVAMVIFLWMRPLWGNLQSLSRATQAFGEGHFNTRANTSKYSPIKGISQSFNAMAHRIQTLISSHKELTNAVSHELRTPLARLRFSLEMIESSTREKDKNRYLNEMHIDINELDALINELLTYARFEREKPEINYQYITVINWVKQQIIRANHLAAPLKIRLTTDNLNEMDTISIESRLMARALNNLINNAIKYADTLISISVSKQPAYYQFIVDDDGPGIPHAMADEIFEPFKRADSSRDRGTGGFGLGLAIAKQIIDWHQGNIILAQPHLGGARFIITLPYQEESQSVTNS